MEGLILDPLDPRLQLRQGVPLPVLSVVDRSGFRADSQEPLRAEVQVVDPAIRSRDDHRIGVALEDRLVLVLLVGETPVRSGEFADLALGFDPRPLDAERDLGPVEAALDEPHGSSAVLQRRPRFEQVQVALPVVLHEPEEHRQAHTARPVELRLDQSEPRDGILLELVVRAEFRDL